jgi:thiol:disulfide interchange protein DsbD
MKKLICLIILSTLCLISCTKPQQQTPVNISSEDSKNEGIAWIYDLNQGLALAESSNKPLMVDFMASWCSWCKKLDKEVYSRTDLIEASKKFVCVKVDTDRFGDISSKYGVTGLPTIIFMNKKGEIIDKMTGYRPGEDFLKAMSKAVTNG